MLNEDNPRQAAAENVLEQGLTNFITHEMENIYDGSEPAKKLDSYIAQAWYASGLTGIELEQITDSGIQIWNSRFSPNTPAQRDALAILTDEEIRKQVGEVVYDSGDILKGTESVDESLAHTGYRKLGAAGKVVSAIAGLALMVTVATATMSCNTSDADTALTNKAKTEQVQKAVKKGGEARKQPKCKINPKQPAECCIEDKVDFEYASTRFTDKRAKKKIENLVLAAKKAGADELDIGGFASPEDKPDMVKYGKAVNNDSTYNVRLSMRRANRVARIARYFARKHKIDLKVKVNAFGETEVFGKYTYPDKGHNPNRTAVIAARPFSDPDKNKLVTPQKSKKDKAPLVSCTDDSSKVEKKDWKTYKPAPATKPAQLKYTRQTRTVPNTHYTPAAPTADQNLLAQQLVLGKKIQKLRREYNWQQRKYKNECGPVTDGSNTLCQTTRYGGLCQGGEPRHVWPGVIASCDKLRSDMGWHYKKLMQNIDLMNRIALEIRKGKAGLESKVVPGPTSALQQTRFRYRHEAEDPNVLIVPGTGYIHIKDNPNKVAYK